MLSSFRRQGRELSDIIHETIRQSENYILAYLSSLIERERNLRHLLKFFVAPLYEIVYCVLSIAIDHDSILRRVLEECYKQSVDKNGTLHVNQYYDSLEKPSLSHLTIQTSKARCIMNMRTAYKSTKIILKHTISVKGGSIKRWSREERT